MFGASGYGALVYGQPPSLDSAPAPVLPREYGGGMVGKDKYLLRMDKDGRMRLKKVIRRKKGLLWEEYEVDATLDHPRMAWLAYHAMEWMSE